MPVGPGTVYQPVAYKRSIFEKTWRRRRDSALGCAPRCQLKNPPHSATLAEAGESPIVTGYHDPVGPDHHRTHSR